MGGGDPMDADAARTRLVDFYQPTKQRAQTKICKRRSGLGEAKRKAKGRAQSAEAEGSLSLSLLASCFHHSTKACALCVSLDVFLFNYKTTPLESTVL